MNEEKKKILQMLSEGKIKAEEAALLLEQLESPRREDAPGRTDEKMLRVRISASEPGRETPVQVAVNLPLKAARLAGQILPSLIPRSAREEIRGARRRGLAGNGLRGAGRRAVGDRRRYRPHRNGGRGRKGPGARVCGIGAACGWGVYG